MISEQGHGSLVAEVTIFLAEAVVGLVPEQPLPSHSVTIHHGILVVFLVIALKPGTGIEFHVNVVDFVDVAVGYQPLL